MLVATVLTVYGIETESKRANIRRFELVATVLTVYGIETTGCTPVIEVLVKKLQQYLPFTVLKPVRYSLLPSAFKWQVATVLTVYGIETKLRTLHSRSYYFRVATVLTVYGIET